MKYLYGFNLKRDAFSTDFLDGVKITAENPSIITIELPKDSPKVREIMLRDAELALNRGKGQNLLTYAYSGIWMDYEWSQVEEERAKYFDLLQSSFWHGALGNDNRTLYDNATGCKLCGYEPQSVSPFIASASCFPKRNAVQSLYEHIMVRSSLLETRALIAFEGLELLPVFHKWRDYCDSLVAYGLGWVAKVGFSRLEERLKYDVELADALREHKVSLKITSEKNLTPWVELLFKGTATVSDETMSGHSAFDYIQERRPKCPCGRDGGQMIEGELILENLDPTDGDAFRSYQHFGGELTPAGFGRYTHKIISKRLADALRPVLRQSHRLVPILSPHESDSN